MRVFYIEDIGPNTNTTKLPSDEAKHCLKVLRLKKGDKIEIVNGKGQAFECEITDLTPKQCNVNILSVTEYKHENALLEIAIAPTKNLQRIEWFVEKAVEIGVQSIYFIKTKHSERKEIKLERIKKIAISAMKQSKKTHLPTLKGMIDLDEYLQICDATDKKIAYVLTENEDSLAKSLTRNSNTAILIGPEGGFSPEEVVAAEEANFEKVSLGKSRLRTETAGVVACTTFQIIND